MTQALLMKIVGGLILLAVVAGSIQYGRHWKGKAMRYNAEAEAMYQAIKVAAANPKLARRDTVEQIQRLGQGLERLRWGLSQCRGSVTALNAASAKQQGEAAAALNRAADRVKGAATAVAALEASARAPQSGGCVSEELKRRWK